MNHWPVTDFSIYEVGPRDGLQSRDTITPTRKKVELIEKIADVGIENIEVGAMVSHNKVPNMADSAVVFDRVSYLQSHCELGVLVPNKRGVELAREIGATKFNIFFSPSEYFNMNNLGRNTHSAIAHYCDALEGIRKKDVRVYLSTAFGCPITGDIPERDMKTALDYADTLGSSIVLCDTIGNANPTLINEVVSMASETDANLALHLHHGLRKGKMTDNLSAAFDCGIDQFDSSIGGLGGCPFIPGSGGNLATEQLVAWGEKENLDCGVSLRDLRPLVNYVDKSIKIGL